MERWLFYNIIYNQYIIWIYAVHMVCKRHIARRRI